jgi:hypothetical protein
LHILAKRVALFILFSFLYLLARFELSAQARRRSEDLTPAASTTSERSAMLTHPSTELWSREHRASCGTRMRGPSGRARAPPPAAPP